MPVARPADGFAALSPLLPTCERPARYIDHEWGAHRKPDASYRVALVYPDTYEIGMANQALSVLYARLNTLDDVAAERAFVPWKDLAAAMRAEDVLLATLETSTPLAACDVIGVTLPCELTFPTVLETLDLAGLPLRAADRGSDHPLVIGGGPASYDPEPMAPFFDAVFIGEAEDGILEIVDVHRRCLAEGEDRTTTLRRLAAGVDGLYVPSLYEGSALGAVAQHASAPARVRRRIVAGFSATEGPTCPVVPYMDVIHDRATVEITRGCTRGCRFCQAGIVYRPVRERSADAIVREAMATLTCTGYEEVSLTSLSSADHSQLEDVLRRLSARLRGRAVSVSLPSLRVDAFSVEMAGIVAQGKKTGLTLAPEAGTQRLRDVINKGVTEEDLLSTVDHAFHAGWRRIKLYFMIGLPTETDDDVAAIGDLVKKVIDRAREAAGPSGRGAVRLSVSVSTFVPKAHTPFQWEPQIDRDQVAHRQRILRSTMPGRGVDLSYHDVEVSLVEGAIARGGREIADVIEAAWRGGAAFSAWTEEFDPRTWAAAFRACGLPAPNGGSPTAPGEPTPWEHIDTGVTRAFLETERERAVAGVFTEDCAAGSCSSCGVCSGEVRVDVAGERR